MFRFGIGVLSLLRLAGQTLFEGVFGSSFPEMAMKDRKRNLFS